MRLRTHLSFWRTHTMYARVAGAVFRRRTLNVRAHWIHRFKSALREPTFSRTLRSLGDRSRGPCGTFAASKTLDLESGQLLEFSLKLANQIECFARLIHLSSQPPTV